MKTKLKTRSQSRPAELIVYMEVYSSNRVVYRVTAGSIVRQGIRQPTYGIMLEDLYTEERQSIPDFSGSLEQTIRFANDLIRREVKPSGLYDMALEHLSRRILEKGKIFTSDLPAGFFPDRLPRPVLAGSRRTGNRPCP